MGANVWQRDSSGTGQGTTFKIGSAAAAHPARPGKRKLVWTKDQQEQPATPAASTPSPAMHRASNAPSTSYSQPDHFEKRARLNDSSKPPQTGYHHNHQAPMPRRHQGAWIPLPETRQQQSGAAAADPASVLQRRKKEAELAELKRRIQEHEEQAAEHKVASCTVVACSHSLSAASCLCFLLSAWSCHCHYCQQPCIGSTTALVQGVLHPQQLGGSLVPT